MKETNNYPEDGVHVIPVRASGVKEALLLMVEAMGFDKELLKDKDPCSISWMACSVPVSARIN